MEFPKVSIIILVYNNYIDTKECLNSLGEVSYPNYDVIVVDNGSADNSVRQLKDEYSKHTFIFNEDNLGFAGGVNTGIREATQQESDYILLLGNDVIVEKSFLEPLVSEMQNSSNVAITGSMVYYYAKTKVINFAGGKVNLWRGGTKHLGAGEKDEGQYDELKKEQEYQDGCSMLIRTSVFDKIGLFDETYFLYYEEVDFCCRARKAGYKIITVPQSKVWHKISLTVGGADSLIAIYHTTKSRIIFMRKYAAYYHWLFFVFYYTYSVLRRILKWIVKDKGQSFNQRMKALCTGMRDGIKTRF